MLEQPWPSPGPGPQQPRDAHRQHWANDARHRPPTGGAAASSGPDAWGERPAREPAVRRRADHVHRDDGVARDGVERSGHEDGVGRPDAPARDGREPARRRPSSARWVPAEEWIPDPTPAPEQRWSPEQDWLAAFADRGETAEPPSARSRARRGRWVVAGAAVLVLGVALGVGLLAFL
ncbi:hypothetical protein [Cellulomonas xiejunii]|uniref:hypothetical protein n=1 Tax=Cellulomonas xiejunii TaxID=2968083 RepID=UPI001D0F2CAE|nr:hypothetical protein [Cellulomonas xiejunii]MCC2313404.1 hypothetical protein [Cellulomonas xiejunii]